MNARDVIKAGLAVAEPGQLSKFADLLSDDMVFARPLNQLVSKREFVGLQIGSRWQRWHVAEYLGS